jgi:hypothetical protein
MKAHADFAARGHRRDGLCPDIGTCTHLSAAASSIAAVLVLVTG